MARVFWTTLKLLTPKYVDGKQQTLEYASLNDVKHWHSLVAADEAHDSNPCSTSFPLLCLNCDLSLDEHKSVCNSSQLKSDHKIPQLLMILYLAKV